MATGCLIKILEGIKIASDGVEIRALMVRLVDMERLIKFQLKQLVV
jgi:hypothetical protein